MITSYAERIELCLMHSQDCLSAHYAARDPEGTLGSGIRKIEVQIPTLPLTIRVT